MPLLPLINKVISEGIPDTSLPMRSMTYFGGCVPHFLLDDLFALNGQPDSEGPANFDIYAAFNRVVSSSAARFGNGIRKAIVTLCP